MKRLLLVLLLTFSLVTVTGNVKGDDCQTGFIKMIPTRSVCANGNTVTYTITFINNNDTTLSSGRATFKASNDFEIVSTNPSLTVLDNIVNFTTPSLEPGSTYSVKIKLKVDTTETRIGYPMLVSCEVVHHSRNSCMSSCQGIILLWAQSKYPPIKAQLKEESRENGELNFTLEIDGGYPPYEYMIYWGDKSDKNSGGLREKGEVELAHTYESTGEYHIVCRITDSLGRHMIIRKRIYLLSWKIVSLRWSNHEV